MRLLLPLILTACSLQRIQTPLPESGRQIVGLDTWFGECSGECQFDVSIVGYNEVTYVASGWDDTVYRANAGTLTLAGLTELGRDTQPLDWIDLDEVYGCPDCNDGGGMTVTILDGTITSTTSFPIADPPEFLEGAADLAAALRATLCACEDSDLIETHTCGDVGEQSCF